MLLRVWTLILAGLFSAGLGGAENKDVPAPPPFRFIPDTEEVQLAQADPPPRAIDVEVSVQPAANATAAPACIEGPEVVETEEKERYTAILRVPLTESGSDYEWTVRPADVACIYGENKTETFFVLSNLTRGKVAERTFFVSFVSWDKRQHVTHEITLKGPVAPPDPDPPPIPPTPPTPPEPPTPAPIPEPGFRVLIVYESAEMQSYPRETNLILSGGDVREFLKTHCVAEGKQAAFRIYDKDVHLGGELEVWKQAMTRPRTALPWVVISNGTTGFEGPLPKTASEFLELCKKYLPTK